MSKLSPPVLPNGQKASKGQGHLREQQTLRLCVFRQETFPETFLFTSLALTTPPGSSWDVCDLCRVVMIPVHALLYIHSCHRLENFHDFTFPSARKVNLQKHHGWLQGLAGLPTLRGTGGLFLKREFHVFLDRDLTHWGSTGWFSFFFHFITFILRVTVYRRAVCEFTCLQSFTCLQVQISYELEWRSMYSCST